MNLDDLKKSWKQANQQMTDGSNDRLVEEVVTRAAKFEQTILRRDWIETAASGFVLVVVGIFLPQDFYPWVAKLGMVIMMLGAIEVVVVMHWTRRWDRRPCHDLPLTEFCAAEIVRVDRQIRLLRNVNWWYTGPLLLGPCVLVWGISFSTPDLPRFISLPVASLVTLLVLLFGWKIYQLNQRAVCQELRPIREELAAFSLALAGDGLGHGTDRGESANAK